MSASAPRPPAWSRSRLALLEQRLAERGLDGDQRRDGQPREVPPAPEISPPDAVEIELTRIWESALGVQPIGRRQNFFELGGDSLLAVRVFAEIWRATGRELPLTSILEAPTIELLARRLRQDRGHASSPVLVPMQPFGQRPPLFCVHQHSGQIFCYQLLARYLGTEQPVYGVRAPAPTADALPPARIEDMASRYVEEIRSLQARGPYHLVGYCFGGILAFEMARQLTAAGEEVGLLALLETARPGRDTGVAARVHRAVHRAAFEMENMVRQPRGLRLAWAFGRVVNVAGEQARALSGRVRNRATRTAPPLSPQQHAIRRIEAGHEEASRRYVPRSYKGSIALFRPDGLSAKDYGDAYMGWDGLAGAGITVHAVPGGASTIVNEPSVKALAERLQHHIAAQARRS